MSACLHYNNLGAYRCSLELDNACHECGKFEASNHGVEFETNSLCDPDTVIGDRDTNRDKVSGYAINTNKPTVDTVIGGVDFAEVFSKPTVDTVIPDTDSTCLSCANYTCGEDAFHSACNLPFIGRDLCRMSGYKQSWKPIDYPDTDAVHSPAHYAGHYPVEVKDIIALVLLDVCDRVGEELNAFQCYCLGNELKYRLRAGLKGDAAEDIAKAMRYAEFRREG